MENNQTIGHEEMRFIRREFINECLHMRAVTSEMRELYTLETIKVLVRLGEVANIGYELRAYA